MNTATVLTTDHTEIVQYPGSAAVTLTIQTGSGLHTVTLDWSEACELYDHLEQLVL